MNAGTIVVHGHCGDLCAYSMRGGKIYVRDGAGVRCGIHMKEYKEHKPILVVGETCGECLGEYMAGGLIIVLNRSNALKPYPLRCGIGQHGGLMLFRLADTDTTAYDHLATADELKMAAPYIEEFCAYFNESAEDYQKSRYIALRPAADDPYVGYYIKN